MPGSPGYRCYADATAYEDYEPIKDGSGLTTADATLTIGPDESTGTVSVLVYDDVEEDSGEGVELITTNHRIECLVSGSWEWNTENCAGDRPKIADADALGTIHNYEEAGPFEVTVADATGSEGETIDFVVTLAASTTGTVTMDYATAGNTATEGEDYTVTSGSIRWPAGTTSTTISVPIAEDDVDEEDETFTLTLSNLKNATFSGSATTLSATGTIAGTATTTTPLTASLSEFPTRTKAPEPRSRSTST